MKPLTQKKMQLDVEVSPPASDGQTDGQKAMHMSPPCISTGVLKKVPKQYPYRSTICVTGTMGYISPRGDYIRAYSYNISVGSLS